MSGASNTTSNRSNADDVRVAEQKRTPRWLLWAGVGVWGSCQVAAAITDAATIDVKSAVLAAGALVVVPLAGDLFASCDSNPRPSHQGRWKRLGPFLAAAMLAVGISSPQGSLAAVLATPWAAYTVLLAFARVRKLVANRDRAAAQVAEACAWSFLVVGGGWAWMSCAGYSPLGFEEPIVRLTAVHFHYAGFALPAIALRVATTRRSRFAHAVLFAVFAGVPAVAAAIASRSTAVELAATFWLAAACVAVAGLQMRVAFGSGVPTAASSLAISSLSLATAMLLAVIYAAGRFLGTSGLDIPTMVATHGMLNALGFAGCGLIGWRFLRRGA